MKDNQAVPGPCMLVDTGIVQSNAKEFQEAFPSIGLAYDVCECGDFKVLEILKKTATPAIVSCNNKLEVEESLKVVSPERVVLSNPLKPASHIKFSLSRGVRIFGCGSVGELDKIQRCAGQVGAEGVQVLIALNILEAESHNALQDQALDILHRSKDSNISIIGVSLFDNSPSTLLHFLGKDNHEDAFKKLIAMVRVVFEAGLQMGISMKILDIGHVLDMEEGTDELPQIGSAIAWEQLCSQFSSYNSGKGTGLANVEVLCHVTNRFLRKTLTLSVEVICKFMNMDQPSVVINESIYGAFQGVLAGDVYKNISSSSEGSDEIRIDIFGDSGDDIDVIARNIKVSASLQVGDKLLFPNIGSVASLGVCDGLSIYVLDPDGSRLLTPASKFTSVSLDSCCKMTVDEEYENAFALPDISEDTLGGLLREHDQI